MDSDVYNHDGFIQRLLMGTFNGDCWIHPLSSSTDVQLCRIQIPLRLCVCVCVPQNGFLRSSFEMKEHEENGNGKKWATNYAMFCETTKFSPRRRGCCAFTLVFHLIFPNRLRFKFTLLF